MLLSGKVQDSNGTPIVSAPVKLSNINFGNAVALTDNLGNFSGLVPKNESFSLEILDNFGTVVYSSKLPLYWGCFPWRPQRHYNIGSFA